MLPCRNSTWSSPSVACVGTRTSNHLRRHVDADHPARRSDLACGQEGVEAGAAPESSTRSRGVSAAMACGFPQPSPRSAPSGTLRARLRSSRVVGEVDAAGPQQLAPPPQQLPPAGWRWRHTPLDPSLGFGRMWMFACVPPVCAFASTDGGDLERTQTVPAELAQARLEPRRRTACGRCGFLSSRHAPPPRSPARLFPPPRTDAIKVRCGGSPVTCSSAFSSQAQAASWSLCSRSPLRVRIVVGAVRGHLPANVPTLPLRPCLRRCGPRSPRRTAPDHV